MITPKVSESIDRIDASFRRLLLKLVPASWSFVIVLTALGALGIVSLKPRLVLSDLALGSHTLPMFIPYLVAVGLACIFTLHGKFSKSRLILFSAIFVVLVLFFGRALMLKVQHLKGDDSYRYSIEAHNIVEQKTLWGSDSVVNTGPRELTDHFIPVKQPYSDQPGYRYLLAAMILLFGDESRLMQFCQMAMFLVVSMLLLNAMQKSLPERCRFWPTVLVGLTAPYVVKNTLYFYSEWFAVFLFASYVLLYFDNRIAAALVCLALVSFVRQNLLLIVFFMFVFTIWKTRRLHAIPIFLVFFLLPLFHNIFYANEFRFLVLNKGVFGNPIQDPAQFAGIVFRKIFYYLGYSPGDSFTSVLMGTFFAPIAVVVFVYVLALIPFSNRLWLLLIVFLTCAPTFVFGDASYPRFEFVNVWIVYLSSWLFFDHLRWAGLSVDDTVTHAIQEERLASGDAA